MSWIEPGFKVIRYIGCITLCLQASLASANCPLLSDKTMAAALSWNGIPKVGQVYKINNWHVQDGDSIRLKGSDRLRIGLINTPEIGHSSRPDQAFAKQAKQHLNKLLKDYPSVYVKLLPQKQDRYGRWLSQIYDGAGLSAEQGLVEQGLAYVISMNAQGAPECLWQSEFIARNDGQGLWGHPSSKVVDANYIDKNAGGFIRMEGIVTDISDSQFDWYIGLGQRGGMRADVAVKISKAVLANSRFRVSDQHELKQWLGKSLQVRGWLAWRKISEKQIQKGFRQGLMTLYHEDMLKLSSALGVDTASKFTIP
jgi:endonuclease YncB( thermonuclease family)